jgi:hypothetical protein
VPTTCPTSIASTLASGSSSRSPTVGTTRLIDNVTFVVDGPTKISFDLHGFGQNSREL